METLDKGKHCAEKFCNQLDYLPMKCKACNEFFCSEHFKYENHGCEKAKMFDYKIPVCDQCHKTIEFKRGKNLDLCLQEHMQNCQLRAEDQNSKQQMKKYCNFKSCKSKEIFRFECDECQMIFCNRHRLHEDHVTHLPSSKSCAEQVRLMRNKKLISNSSSNITSFGIA